MALEAELIYAAASRGISWEHAQGMELWQLAAALGLHRTETRAARDAREIIDTKQAEWEVTKDARMAKFEGYSERRAESKRRRAQERRQGSRKT